MFGLRKWCWRKFRRLANWWMLLRLQNQREHYAAELRVAERRIESLEQQVENANRAMLVATAEAELLAKVIARDRARVDAETQIEVRRQANAQLGR